MKRKECLVVLPADKSLKIIFDATSLFDFWRITQKELKELSDMLS